MKNQKSIVTFFLLVVFMLSGTIQSLAFTKVQTEKTKVYYFHNERRCPTCLAIEKETKKVLKESPFAEAKENNDLEFKSFNVENAANKKLIKELGVTGSALIIIKGDEKIDLTSKGFMYGLKQPEKLQQAIREALQE